MSSHDPDARRSAPVLSARPYADGRGSAFGADVARATHAYPVPRHLTDRGLQAFGAEIDEFAAALAIELERQEAKDRAHGRHPEHTAEAVARARQAWLRRQAGEIAAADRKTRRNWSVLAMILVTASTVGLNIMQRYLNSGLQIAVFLGFVLAGVTGLGLMWASRPSRSAGDDA